MSVDLQVIPTVDEPTTWRAVLRQLRDAADEGLTALLGEEPRLLALDSKTAVPPDQRLATGRSYVFELGFPNTLVLDVTPNEGFFEEREFLEDYGRNLSREDLETLIVRWKRSGHSYGISSMGGRTGPEPQVFLALATAIARATAGWVVAMESVIDVGVGVYEPDELELAQPAF